MTTVLFMDGAISADRRQQVQIADGQTYNFDGEKVFLSLDKRFAYASSGAVTKPKLRAQVERTIAQAIDDHIANGKIEPFKEGVFTDSVFVIMTKDSVYEIVKIEGGGHKLNEVDDLPFWVAGSGGKLMSVGLYFTKDLKTLFHKVSLSDMWTSKEFDTIKRKDLLSWEGAPVKPVKTTKNKKKQEVKK